MAIDVLDKFDHLIIEAMHIADTVRDISNNLLYNILYLIKHQPYIKSTKPDKPVKYGAFKHKSEYGIAFDVIWDFYNFRNQEEYQQSDVDASCKYYPENNVIYIIVVAVNNKFDEKSIGEDIQHEVAHMFEFYNREEIGKMHKNLESYDKAVDDLLTSASGTLKNDIATIIYLENKAEQRAFANGAYQFLMRSDDYVHNFENAKKRTLLYIYVGQLKEVLNRLSGYKGTEPELLKSLERYKITFERLVKDAATVRKRLAWLMGWIQSKAIDDYRRIHGVQVLVNPRNAKRISEATIKNHMSAIEKYYKDTPLWHGFCRENI